MKTYIALIRGINVGGKNILPMKRLVEIIEGLGLEKVQTYIQSGNVVFKTSTDCKQELAKSIGSAIGAGHGFVPHVLVLSLPDLQNAMDFNPFPEGEDDPKSLHLSFLESSPVSPDLEKLSLLQAEGERFKLRGMVFYLHAPEGIGRSKLATHAEKALGVPMTGRNWRTAGAILSLALKVDS